MQLWNDYEGKTLAGTFPIEALLSTEGRNASFATHDRSGRPAVLRLTEALNDQQEMRARYGAIRDMGQRNLVAIEDFGDVEMEGTPLIYLVMESTEESLAEIIGERALSVEETGEVAISLVAALEALHAHGLVHGNVVPASVLAAGQVVKLRSDCVRPAPEGDDGVRARAADVFGLADVLNRCLTQKPLYDASDALALPEPYASIVRNVARGSWGIEQVASELQRFVRPARPATQAAPEVVAQPAATETRIASPAPTRPLDAQSSPQAAATERAPAERKAARGVSHEDAQLPLVYAEAEENHAPVYAEKAGEGWRPSRAFQAEEAKTGNGSKRMLWVAGAAGVCLMLLAWHFGLGSRAGVSNAAGVPAAKAAPVAVPIAAPAPIATVTPPAPTPIATAPAPVPTPTPHATLRAATTHLHGEVWRVVAYTYNVEAQARAKAKLIGERHAGLHPEVYSRTGKAPYLVTLGGSLTEPQALAMRGRARSQGLAHDVYMQNYSH